MFQPVVNELRIDLDSYFKHYSTLNLLINYLFIIINLFTVVLFLFSLYYHIVKKDNLYLGLLFKCFINGEIENKNENFDYNEDAFLICRSPLRSSLLFFILFANFKWNLGKIFFCLFLYGGLQADSVAEEVYQYQRNKEFDFYVKKVTNRFLPSFTFLFKAKTDKKKEQQKEDIKNK